ncbi:MAG TPA: hypothetical protein VHF88_07665 [Thermoleophilaceae bacterium]|nr:hypothetical protein [Thermoleophilaceae bacterium]
MISHDEYLELCHNAKDALSDLLDETDHDLGTCERTAYKSLKRYIARHEAEADEPEDDDGWAVERARRKAWDRWPMERKRAVVLELLGDKRLTGKELAQRFRQAVAADFDVYEDQVLYIVKKMLGADLDRELEQWGSRGRYRYFRKRGLEGPIAELQRQFDATTREGA